MIRLIQLSSTLDPPELSSAHLHVVFNQQNFVAAFLDRKLLLTVVGIKWSHVGSVTPGDLKLERNKSTSDALMSDLALFVRPDLNQEERIKRNVYISAGKSAISCRKVRR